MTRVAARTAAQHQDRLAAARRAKAFETFTDVLASDDAFDVPPPVTEIVKRPVGSSTKLTAEAYELARQVYYLQQGSFADAARAIIAAGLSDTDDMTIVADRLKTWWGRERWPKRPTLKTFAIRDANNDGGLYRSARVCIDVTTGNGPAPRGKKCTQSALADSDWCFHHDPRPEYVQARSRQVQRLAEGRRAGMVPIAPFQRWLEEQRVRLLEEERARRIVHPNSQGLGVLASRMGIDQSVLTRIIAGRHSDRTRPPVTMIRAATVARYVEPMGVTFEQVYGHAVPALDRETLAACPRCGGRKSHESKTCRNCHDAEGEPCSYVNRRGERCDVLTVHPGGVCAKCRRITERVRRPRTGKPSALTPTMLLVALEEYHDFPIMNTVGARMWAANTEGVQGIYASRKSLTGQLVKRFRREGWNDPAVALTARNELRAICGLVARPLPVADEDGMVPFTPFLGWLTARRAQTRTVAELAGRTSLDADRLSRWLRGENKATVRAATVRRSLDAWGDGTTFADLYRAGA